MEQKNRKQVWFRSRTWPRPPSFFALSRKFRASFIAPRSTDRTPETSYETWISSRVQKSRLTLEEQDYRVAKKNNLESDC